jgi:hypothetical protein
MLSLPSRDCYGIFAYLELVNTPRMSVFLLPLSRILLLSLSRYQTQLMNMCNSIVKIS